MRRKDFLQNPIEHMKITAPLTVDGLIRQFGNSGSFGAGRVATACNVYEKMLRDTDCTVFLAVSGAIVPAGLRTLIADLVRKHLVDVLVCTGASMVHDAIEALGGKHYKGSHFEDDAELYKYHIFRIYDVLVTEEDYIRLDYQFSEIYQEIATERKGEALSTREFAWELGKHITDHNSILRAAYESKVPVYMPAIRDSEFGFIHWLHSDRKGVKNVLKVDAFKEVPEICGICSRSPKNGMVVLGGGSPRNTVQSSALASKKGMDYAVVVTMDRPETGGLSGSTLKESVSWGKVKDGADNVMVIGDIMIVFPLMVAAVMERLDKNFQRKLPEAVRRIGQ